MTTLLIIIWVLLIALAFCIWFIKYLFKREPGFLSDKECIEFAQSMTNHEVTVYDFEQWYSHNQRKIRFSDN